MSNLKINGVTKNFFRAETKKTEGNQTNPFGVSFKGNVLTADVFEIGVRKINLIERARTKSKMVSSAIVGSINDFGSSIGKRMDSVISFGRRIKQNTTDMWQRAKNINVGFDMSKVKNVLNTNIFALRDENSINLLIKNPVSKLEDMLAKELTIV